MSPSPPPRRLDSRGVAGAVLCCALWGGNAVAVKAAVPDLPALGCAGLRFLISLPVVFLACRGLGGPLRVGRKDGGLLLLHAALTVAQIATFNWGTSLSLAGRSSVFINVHPLVVAPLAWLALGERMGPRGLLGLGAAAGGVALLLSGAFRAGGASPGGAGLLGGDLIVLLSGAIFGVQTIAQKLSFGRIPPPTLLFGQAALAVPLFFALSAAIEGTGAYHFTPGAVGGVVYQGLAVSGLCSLVWLLLLGSYPAGPLATLAFLTPLFGVGLGHVLRAEPLTWHLIVGGGLVGGGIVLVASDRVAHNAPPVLGLPGEDAP